MRPANKPALAEAIWKLIGKGGLVLPSGLKFVLDGGSLLAKKEWKKGETFEEICQSYVYYVHSKYGLRTEVVFDGYPTEPITKDSTHFRRTKGKQGKLVKFNLNTKLSMTKDKFLLNKENKQTFLSHLTSYMNAKQSYSDADVLVVTTAVERCCHANVAVIGEDTDLLILLLHHYDVHKNQIYFTTERNIKDKKNLGHKAFEEYTII